ncbi:hypothetical protein PG988_006879 [Apiospora saccharicola]
MGGSEIPKLAGLLKAVQQYERSPVTTIWKMYWCNMRLVWRSHPSSGLALDFDISPQSKALASARRSFHSPHLSPRDGKAPSTGHSVEFEYTESSFTMGDHKHKSKQHDGRHRRGDDNVNIGGHSSKGDKKKSKENLRWNCSQCGGGNNSLKLDAACPFCQSYRGPYDEVFDPDEPQR